MGRGQKHAEGVVVFFLFLPQTDAGRGTGQERPFFNCEKRACKAKSAKNVVIFGEKSPKSVIDTSTMDCIS